MGFGLDVRVTIATHRGTVKALWIIVALFITLTFAKIKIKITHSQVTNTYHWSL